MGALHEGHLSLIRAARRDCATVVVSVFVNPSQFDEASDLAAYPRDEARDFALAAEAGADVVFAPSAETVYPPGFATAVEVGGVSEGLEGAVRGAAHFRGVATVVTKLLNMAMPDVAYFGQKDAQQVAAIRRLVKDLDLAVRIAVCPTVREPDGLAMSSRNARLSADQRRRAAGLNKALEAARRQAAEGECDARTLLGAVSATLTEWSLEPEYVALADPETLAPLDVLDREGLLLIAARLGDTRLIDNTTLAPAGVVRATEREAPGQHALGQRRGKAATVCNA
jgi:pantoate--beta-alanine ligase